MKKKLIERFYSLCDISASVTTNLIHKQQYQMYLQHLALHEMEKGITDAYHHEGCQLVVSLTTYGKRLYDVYLTIESIMQQTMKPNRIVLWLAEDMQNDELPIVLQKQMSRGLEIRFCKDTKSYKKLIPALHEFPDDIIVTIDDDIFFAFDMLENLYRSYKTAPMQVHCNRVHRIKLNGDGTLMRYNDWGYEYKEPGLSMLNFPTGGAGALYPPHILSDEVMNENAFMELSPRADDVWFKAMAMLNGVKCQKVRTHDPYLYFNDAVQDVALSKGNVDNGENDGQIKAVFERYDLYKLLHE